MKKWLIGCLMALLFMMVITTTAFAHTKADGTKCNSEGYICMGSENKTETQHRMTCKTCGEVMWENHWREPDDEATCKKQVRCGLCGIKFGPFGDHKFSKATCVAKATCTVCKLETGEIDPNNHSLKSHAGKAPTCTEKGWEAYNTCTRCNYTTYQEKDALNHDIEKHDAKAPTCTEKGWEAYEACKREGCTYTTKKEIPASGHDKVHHDAKAPTCLEKGWKAYDTCKRCDYTTYQELKALGHDKVHHEAKAPTCLDIGWYAYDTCTRCAYSTRLIRPALGHDLVKHAAKNPTCTEIGWNAYNTCTRCSYTTYQEKAALGHDKVHHDAKDATCLEIGWKEYDTCSRCDYTTYTELKALGHDLVHHEAKDATCLDIGWKAYDTCSRCDYTTYEELPALGHDYKERVHAVTCEKDGYTSHNCSRCGDRYVTDRVAKLNHWFGEWAPVEETTHEAACLREGCGFAANVDCETIEFALALEGQEPLTLSLCPVCGRVEGGESLLLENVTAEALKGFLPLGEAFARLFTLENGEKLLLVGFEYGGKLAKADCPVKITLPAEALAGYSLSLIESDGTLTALEITVDGELATFELDFTGAESPIALIRLIPAA